MAKPELAKLFETLKLRYGRCLDPEMSCDGAAIRAHSVQKATAIDRIAENDHVYELQMKFVEGTPRCEFNLVGRNRASTFTGFCSSHDSELFRPIDTQPLSLVDKRQLFLIAYRSVSRELHASLEGAMRMQSAYLDLAAEGKVPRDEPSSKGLEAIQHMLKPWAVWQYRQRYFDARFKDRKYGEIRHLKFKIKNAPPRLAASSFFSADLKPWGQPFAAVIVNIIPTKEDETVVVFSYSKDHARRATEYLRPITRSSGEQKKYELSHLLVDRAENFFLRPSVVDSWSQEKRAAIEKAFNDTVLEGSPPKDPVLMLF
jgi:hypothetical protein